VSKHHDKTFFVSFLSVLGFLVLFTVAIIIAARALEGDKELTPQQIAKIEDRLKSSGQVTAGANATAGGETATKAPLSGEQVSAQVCSACHMGAIPNSPKIGDKAAWSSRGTLAQLTASAIKGKGAMPPRGGLPSLSDGEIEAAIKHMSGM
jgi:cytochrome c5